MKYVMFLRGINVGGIKVPMVELRQLLEELGLGQVKTYLQTGNVVFKSSEPIARLKPKIEAALSKRFGYTAHAHIYPESVVNQVVEGCPFQAKINYHRYAIFCDSQATIAELMGHKSQVEAGSESIASGNHVVYWQAPIGRSVDTVFAKVLAKPKYKAVTTNRNLNTLQKMLQH